MAWFNEYFTDFFTFNTVFIGLATLSAFFTKRYGVFSLRTTSAIVSFNISYLIFMTLNPYYDFEVFNSLFIIAPIIMLRVYYDIRLTYIFVVVILIASQLKYFLSSASTFDLSLGLLYLVLSSLIILIPTTKNKSIHTLVLFSASYLAIIVNLYFWPTLPISSIKLDILLWGANVFALWFIGSHILPGLIKYIEMTYTIKDLENDALTGVYNRLSFNQHMDMLFLKENNQNISPFSILFFDINKFKQINDTYGHLVGDVVLKDFAKKLENELQEGEKLFRYGGDEFVVYTLRTAESLDELIVQLNLNVQDMPLTIEGQPIVVNYSLGVAEYPIDTASVLEIVKIADAKMFKDKIETSSKP